MTGESIYTEFIIACDTCHDYFNDRQSDSNDITTCGTIPRRAPRPRRHINIRNKQILNCVETMSSPIYDDGFALQFPPLAEKQALRSVAINSDGVPELRFDSSLHTPSLREEDVATVSRLVLKASDPTSLTAPSTSPTRSTDGSTWTTILRG